MRHLSRLLAAAAIATVAACGGTAEVPEDVDVDVDANVQTDTVALPDVDVNRDTTTIITPDIDVKAGGRDTNRTPPPSN